MAKYWFRKRKGLFSKDLGWGWTPISWEGWLVVFASIITIGLSAFFFDLSKATTVKEGVGFLATVVALILAVCFISSKKSK